MRELKKLIDEAYFMADGNNGWADDGAYIRGRLYQAKRLLNDKSIRALDHLRKAVTACEQGYKHDAKASILKAIAEFESGSK